MAERSLMAETLELLRTGGLAALASFAVLGGAGVAATVACGALSFSAAPFGVLAFVALLLTPALAHAGPLAAFAIALDGERPGVGASLRRGMRCLPRLVGPILALLPAAMLVGIATAFVSSFAQRGLAPLDAIVRVFGATVCGFVATWILGVHALYRAASLVLEYPIVPPRGPGEHMVLMLPGFVPIAIAAALIGHAFSRDVASDFLPHGASEVALAGGLVVGVTVSVVVSCAVSVVIAARRPEDRASGI